MRSYSAITCAPNKSTIAASSSDSSTTIDVVSEPYTVRTCDSVARYQTSTCREISHSTVALTPPISAWRHERRPTGITK